MIEHIYTPRKKILSKRNIISAIIFVIVLAGAFVMMYPLIWMMFTSVTPIQYVFDSGLWPRGWRFGNYIRIWSEIDMLRGTINSTIIIIPTLAGSLFTGSLAAFAFAKLKFWGKNTFFMILLSTMMIPGAVLLIPTFVLFHTLGLLHGPLAVIIPRLVGGAFMIFFLRQYLYGVPDSLIESAKIDGASYFTIYLKIIVPLIAPALIAQGILGFIGGWNDFLGALFFIRDRDWFTLPIMISLFNSGASAADNNVPMLMTASLISMIPVFIVFGIFQKKIVNSVMMSGVKL